MRTNLLWALGLVFLASCAQPPIEEYTVIPQPVDISYTPGIIKLGNEPTISYPEELAGEAEILQADLADDHALHAKLQAGKTSGDIRLIIDESILPVHPEGYMIDAKGNEILIMASTSTGVFRGTQTLRQMIKKENGKCHVQQSTVTDYPAFSWRSFLLDEARHYKGKEVVKQLLDEMASLKLNVFHWHLTDDQGWRIEIKKYPKLTEVGSRRDSTEINHFHSNVFDGKPHSGYYTQEDLKEIVAYAKARHINILPEISMPGHASAAIASYPWLGTDNKQIKVPAKFGVHYNVYNVASPKVMNFLSDVMDEVISIFPSEVIHIGGDEVKYDHWKKSAEIRAYMNKNNLKSPAEVQVNFTNDVCEMLTAKGKHMMGWNEITGDKINHYQSDQDTKNMTKKLDLGTIVHFWKGDPALIQKTIQKGYNVVNSYHEYTYLDYSYESIPLEKAYSFTPAPKELSKEEAAKVLGTGCQMWGEFIPTVEGMNHMVYPRIAAYAEGGWTNVDNKDYDRFLKGLDSFLKKWDRKGINYGPIETPAPTKADK